MNSSKTLAEFKRRIRQEELQAGQKNLHGRRFVNWLVQGGQKRKYYAHESGLKKKRMKKSMFRGGENNVEVVVKFNDLFELQDYMNNKLEFQLEKKDIPTNTSCQEYLKEQIFNYFKTKLKTRRKPMKAKNKFKERLDNSDLEITFFKNETKIESSNNQLPTSTTKIMINVIYKTQNQARGNKQQKPQEEKEIQKSSDKSSTYASVSSSKQESQEEEKEINPQITFFKQKAEQDVDNDSVQIKPLSEYFT